MKIDSYNINSPIDGLCKSYGVWGTNKKSNTTSPLFYLKRPKWVKDDAAWRKIIYSIEIKLPAGYEVK